MWQRPRRCRWASSAGPTPPHMTILGDIPLAHCGVVGLLDPRRQRRAVAGCCQQHHRRGPAHRGPLAHTFEGLSWTATGRPGRRRRGSAAALTGLAQALYEQYQNRSVPAGTPTILVDVANRGAFRSVTTVTAGTQQPATILRLQAGQSATANITLANTATYSVRGEATLGKYKLYPDLPLPRTAQVCFEYHGTTFIGFDFRQVDCDTGATIPAARQQGLTPGPLAGAVTGLTTVGALAMFAAGTLIRRRRRGRRARRRRHRPPANQPQRPRHHHRRLRAAATRRAGPPARRGPAHRGRSPAGSPPPPPRRRPPPPRRRTASPPRPPSRAGWPACHPRACPPAPACASAPPMTPTSWCSAAIRTATHCCGTPAPAPGSPQTPRPSASTSARTAQMAGRAARCAYCRQRPCRPPRRWNGSTRRPRPRPRLSSGRRHPNHPHHPSPSPHRQPPSPLTPPRSHRPPRRPKGGRVEGGGGRAQG